MRNLILFLLAVVSLPVSAEELQVTISGFACVFVSDITECDRGAFTTPATVTYDVNTRSGQQTFLVAAGIGNEGEVLVHYRASNLAVTNYSAILGGQSVAFAAHTTGEFEFTHDAPNEYDFAGGANEGSKAFFFDSFATPILTAAEFETLQDPLASLLLKYRSSPAACIFCLLGSDPLLATMTITPVPTPGILPLLLAGLIALGLFRVRGIWTSGSA